MPLGGIGVPRRNQPLDQGDHLRDVGGGAGLDIGRQRAERRHVGVELGRGAPGQRVDCLTGLARGGDDLVLDIGDVADLADSLGAVCPALPGSAATPLPDIRGIYVIGQKFDLENSPMPGQQTWLQQAIASPAVDGILIDLDWTDVASPTATKTYSWTLLDSMAQLAIAQGKKFEIAIITGGTTPSWVFTPQPQGLGAAFSNFEYVQADKPGATCINEQLALPWDSNYIAALADLLQQLSAHLKAQGWYSSMTMLRLTGINTLTDELRLPAQPPSAMAQFPCLNGNLQAWISAGYTQGKLATGWQQMLTASLRAFPDKFFNVALITDNGFPT